jgi:hypothetical protein
VNTTCRVLLAFVACSLVLSTGDHMLTQTMRTYLSNSGLSNSDATGLRPADWMK